MTGYKEENKKLPFKCMNRAPNPAIHSGLRLKLTPLRSALLNIMIVVQRRPAVQCNDLIG
jgi:hypothetical protein